MFYLNLKKVYPILIFLIHIFVTHLAIKWRLVSHLTQHLLLHYLGKQNRKSVH